MILLSWAEDFLFNNYAIITVIVLIILSFLYEYIEKYIKLNCINKARAEIPHPRRREFSNSRPQHKNPYHTFSRKKNNCRKGLQRQKKNVPNKSNA